MHANLCTHILVSLLAQGFRFSLGQHSTYLSSGLQEWCHQEPHRRVTLLMLPTPSHITLILILPVGILNLKTKQNLLNSVLGILITLKSKGTTFFSTSGQSVHYICSQYLANSSLSEAVSQYDFSTPIQVKLSYCVWEWNYYPWKISWDLLRYCLYFLMSVCFAGLFCNWSNVSSVEG